MKTGILKISIIRLLFASRVLLCLMILVVFSFKGFTSDILIYLSFLSAPSTVLVLTTASVFVVKARYTSIGEKTFSAWIWYVFFLVVSMPQIIIITLNGFFGVFTYEVFLLMFSIFECGLSVFVVLFSSKFLFTKVSGIV